MGMVSTDNDLPYPDVVSRPDFPSLELEILTRWKTENIFERSVEQHKGIAEGGEEFVFNDGPPFANGLPHYGHLLTGYVKDVIPRFQTMRGQRVERRFGWDCHGLPAEMHTEKELGISGRKAIAEYGIDKFNQSCESSVLRYTEEWEHYVERQARWVDFENDYKTMDLAYMESVIWAFKQLHDKGLLYEADRVMAYSWGAETPLSNFEIRLDDATRPRQDPALTVKFKLDGTLAKDGPFYIAAWTTTPWTLPSNLALAVGPEIEYVLTEDASGDRVIVAREAVGQYSKELAVVEPEVSFLGSELVGQSYTPLFPYFENHTNAFKILGANFVETGDGTGVVHLAPGFGEEDQRVCVEQGISLVVPVDDEGNYTSAITEFAGQNVFDANPNVIKHLKTQGNVVRHETYDHNYPHCWRTDTPIIYRAINSWYLRVTDLTDRLLETNQGINWIPDHVRDGAFGRWLEGARDWSISRNRFWGAPIPVWKSDNPEYPRVDVYGSLDELERDFGVRPDNLHRPFVDDLTRPNPDDPTGKSTMRRVPEVLDCWFESGSMPYAQLHYPFENTQRFENHNPADFIVEYIAQTRGWFYTMHVLSVALFDKPAFKNVICHGVVLDNEGRKISKKLQNYPDPLDMFEKYGSDALRWFLISSPILRGQDLRISKDGAEIRDTVRQVLNPIWSTYSFFTLYANAEGYTAKSRTDSTNLLDKYILAKTHDLVVATGERLEAYDLSGACTTVQHYLDALTNWYIRRSRERFWNTNKAEGDTSIDEEALDTLYTVLTTLARVIAPLAPMVAEKIWTGLSNDDSSVHLQAWPHPAVYPDDAELVSSMDRLRAVASTALSLRDERGLRIRLPLSKATIAGVNTEAMASLVDLLTDEINVKEVIFSDDVERYGTFRLRPNGRVLGPLIGGDVQVVIKAAKAGEWEANEDGSVTVAGHRLVDDQFELALDPVDGVAAAPLPGNDAVVVLDTDVTAELEAEGLARDLVRLVQQERKDLDFNVTDRIVLTLQLPDELRQALDPHTSWVMSQILAVDIAHTNEPLERVVELGAHTIGLHAVVANG